MMSPEDIAAHDKRNAALHEAGHAVLAHEFVAFANAWITPNPDGSPLGEKYWVGKCRYNPAGLSTGEAAAIAVAGVVAEALAKEPFLDPDEFVDSWESDYTPSDTDMTGIPTARSKRIVAVRRAMRILRGQQSLLEAVATHLMKHESIGETEMNELRAA